MVFLSSPVINTLYRPFRFFNDPTSIFFLKHTLLMTNLGALHLVAAVPSHVCPLGQSIHALSSMYFGALHLVAAVPSHVLPLGQSIHALSLMYFEASHFVAVVPSHVLPLG